ncbi:MAG: V-type ATPase subunit [Eubacteriales bacterium]|nr:V-type ATPase subunit [Eubacteriales bacterium]
MNTRIKDTDYAFAVARIRANEPGLLTESDLDQLISAENYSSALRMLEEMGWIESEDREDIDAALKRHGMRVWRF